MSLRPAEAPRLVLASASRIRAEILQQAGATALVMPARIDEAAVKEALRREGADAAAVAAGLAELKAMRISQREPDALVIGADQVLTAGEAWFDKAADLDQARRHLQALRGRTHELHTAVCLVQGGRGIWQHQARCRLLMRPFSDAFLEAYLASAGDAVLESVGGYQVEGFGMQLFGGIEGDWHSILGLPLLPLLEILREHGVLLR
jgi:septum formation protein